MAGVAAFAADVLEPARIAFAVAFVVVEARAVGVLPTLALVTFVTFAATTSLELAH